MKESWMGIAQLLKDQDGILIMAGDLCSRLRTKGRMLWEYVVDLSKDTGTPVAATGGSFAELAGKDIAVKKMWAAEIINDLHRSWRENLTADKPRVLVLIGYNSQVARRLIAAAGDTVDTVFLGTSPIEEATLSLPQSKLEEFGGNLEKIINAL